MQEDFLHYIWLFKLFSHALFDTREKPVLIVESGVKNTNAGPDFLNAKVRIGDTLWAGHVEIHLRASDWNRHQHQTDATYNAVVLHVVYECDLQVQLENGDSPLCVELKPFIHPELILRYEGFLKSHKWIPCSGQLHTFPEMKQQLFFTRLSVERLEQKAAQILQALEANQNDWEETFYQMLAGGFGLHINRDAFVQLAESLPLKILSHHREDPFQVEALLFGQSGLLEEDFVEEYPAKLKKEYAYLKQKWGLTPMDKHRFKFLRLRPSNFPSIRIAQFAAFISSRPHLFSSLMEARSVSEINAIFKLNLPDYWKTHFLFKHTSAPLDKPLSEARIQLLIINVVAPFLFVYGQHQSKEKLSDRALDLLEELPAEDNRWIKQYKLEGIKIHSALASQALLQLKTYYCDQKKCLHCSVGNYLLR